MTLFHQQALLHLQDVHESLKTADISVLCPLTTENHIIAWHPHADAKQIIVLSQGITPSTYILAVIADPPHRIVLTVYTKSDGRGAKYDWSKSRFVRSVGGASYVIVQAYLLLQGLLYTSTSQPEMQTTSFPRIPRTHIIMMSLASFASDTTVQAVPLADGS